MNRSRVRFNVGGVDFSTSVVALNSRGGNIDRLLRENLNYIDRDPAIFPVFLNYMRGYELTSEFIKQAGVNSGYLPKTFYSMLYQDCQLYNIPEVTSIVENFLLDEMPSLLRIDVITRLTNTEEYDIKMQELVRKNQEMAIAAKEAIEIGDLELDQEDIKVINDICSGEIWDYTTLHRHKEFLETTVKVKKSRHKVKGMFPQILTWFTKMMYKWLGVANDGDTINSKVRMFLKSHPTAADEFCNSMDQIGWERAEPLLDYAMMAAVDAAISDSNL